MLISHSFSSFFYGAQWYNDDMAFADPDGNVAQLGKIKGLSVADFGAGVGAYTIACAKKVGDSGRVYAIEVQKSLLPKIKNTAANMGLSNVEVLWGDVERLEATKLADGSVDIVIAANVFFQVEDKTSFIAEVKRVLKPKGRVLFVDWKDSYGGLGPAPDSVVLPDEARSYFENDGFEFLSTIETGDHHYGFVMNK